jgi:hypothetical protein
MRKRRVDLSALCMIGTLAHNRSFTAKDYAEYLRFADRGGRHPPPISTLVTRGVIKRVGRGQFYPTPQGWKVIERSCRLYRR